ncbi:MAG: 50S ribosomal protein L18 [bacterium]
MDRRKLRHRRVRKKISGTAERPRMCVFVSNRNLYVQLVDDTSGGTLYSLSTMDKELKKEAAGKSMRDQAVLVGKKFAEGAVEKGYKSVVFDRGGCRYGLRLKKLADAAREAGLNF